MSFNIAFQFSYMTMIIERGWEFTGIRQAVVRGKDLLTRASLNLFAVKSVVETKMG